MIEYVSVGGHLVVQNPSVVFNRIPENLYHENTHAYRLEATATLSHHTYTVHEKCKCTTKCINDSMDDSGKTMCINAATYVECDKYNCSVSSEGDCGNRRLTLKQTREADMLLCQYAEGSLQMRLNGHAQRKCGLKVPSQFYAAVNKSINAGEIITEYLGEYSFPTNKSWCAIQLNDLVYTRRDDDVCIVKNVYLDAQRYGNIAKYCEHSCDPNAKLVVTEVQHQRRYAIVALKHIEVPVGELVKITFDYANLLKKQGQKCYCGTVACRNPWPTSPKAYEEEFLKAIKCNCRKCRGSKGSKAENIVEELQEKDTIKAKPLKSQDVEASEKDNSDSDSDYEEDNKKSKKSLCHIAE